MEHKCLHEVEINELREDVKRMRDDLHEGDKRFQNIENSLVSVCEKLEMAVKAIGDLIKETQANTRMLFAVKWIVVGAAATIVVVKTGLVEFLVGVIL